MERKVAERLLRDFAAAAHDLKMIGSLELGKLEDQIEASIRRVRYRRLRQRILQELAMIEAFKKADINFDPFLSDKPTLLKKKVDS